MRYFYAELDGSNKVKCVLDTDREISSTSMIQVGLYDVSLLGKTYSGGEFLTP